MSTANEYRQFGEECLRWARTAKTEDERKAFLDMARLWTQAAAKVLNGEAVPDANSPIRQGRSGDLAIGAAPALPPDQPQSS